MNRPNLPTLLLRAVATLCAVICSSQVLAQTDATSQQTLTQRDFFETKIRPVLWERCLDCHSGDAPESNFSVETRSALLQGGDFGPAVVPHRPDDSLLISAINHGEFLKMPPKDKLPTEQLLDFARWIEMGAPWPNASNGEPVDDEPSVSRPLADDAPISQQQLSFWSLQPLAPGKPPHVRDAKWGRSPLDRFVLAGLDAVGLQPAPPADRLALIRRATFDLTGLPPSAQEIREFLADESPQAFARVVDRLLASPRYGERWGRHWLDVARYADSNGLDENIAYAHAHRYRDYVIRAWNVDKPFDCFLAEQVAGDLLGQTQPDADVHEQFVATGFLAIGAKMLAEDDPVKMQMDIIDEQLHTLGQAFMGLTLGCARCHDHKFDPISTRDYYGLAGIFKSTKTMENHQVVAKWYERPLADQPTLQRITSIQQQVMAKRNDIQAIDERARTASSASQDGTADLSEEDRQRTEQLRSEISRLEASLPRPAIGMGVTEAATQDVSIHIRGSHLALGEIAPRGFLRALTQDSDARPSSTQSGRVELARWMTREDHPLTSRVIANRIWHWHFGRGIVASVDNFGALGQAPSHPRLLDWLAKSLIQSNWSVKSLHRKMMLSSTYRMSTRFNQHAASVDPENRLLWRMNRRRLTAEEMRDSVIAHGAGLDFAMGGSLLKVANRAYVTSSGTNVTDEYDNRRRSVYLPVVRSSVYDVFQTLDFPDPAVSVGQRQVSTVAPQALMLMNSQLVEQQTRFCAFRLMARADLDSPRIEKAYRHLLGRLPTDQETQQAERFLAQVRTARADELAAWQSFVRVLMSTNEYAYVE